MNKSNIGLIGLAVMGANIARNIADKGYSVSVYNRTASVTDEFIKDFGSDNLKGFNSLEEFVESLERPRKVIVLVKAGDPVDKVIKQLLPLLDDEDIVIDLGNSNFKDTIRREAYLKEKGLRFIGSGVSGGEEGALNGPSLMPGGPKSSWLEIKDIFEAIAAKDFSGGACVTHIGENGAGHYVKMVHNGIEYGIMQILAEVYFLLDHVYNLTPDKISEIFSKLNKGKLESFLVEISAEVTGKKDDLAEGFLIDKVLDYAKNKGTGRWTVIDSLETGVPSSVIAAGVFARLVSSYKELRVDLSGQISSAAPSTSFSVDEFVDKIEHAVYTSVLCSYAQGYDMIRVAAKEYNWNINFAEVSRIWQGGCIIRARVLTTIEEVYRNESDQDRHLFQIKPLQTELLEGSKHLRELVLEGVKNQLPVPALSSALNYYDSLHKRRLSANFIQALRDNFGAHTYERIDKDGSFHSNWKE